MNLELWERPEVIKHAGIIASSHFFWTKKPIVSENLSPSELSKALYFAPLIVVSHGTERDPIFNYANNAAQLLWRIGWDEFTSMPSRLSAEPIEESRRNALLEEGKNKGITYLEKGVRIDKEGRRFFILDVVLFNLLDNHQNYLGQGAVYHKWEYVD